MKCPLCQSRKGKRYCPAKKVSICPQCCGEKRVVEIACPPDCQYLTSGQSFQAGKDVVQQLTRTEDPELRQKILQMRLRFPGLVHFLERIIVEFAQTLSSLNDQDLAEAVDIVFKRYELEQKGLIFQHKSPKPFVEALASDLSRGIEEQRNPQQSELGESGGIPLPLLTTALEVLAADIGFHSRRGENPTAYLSHIRRNHPEVGPPRRGGGLIIPG